MIKNTAVAHISSLISERLSAGFTPDADAMHFACTSYDIQGNNELLRFLGDSSLNDGTFYELTVFPDDGFRLMVERVIPSSGLDDRSVEEVRESVVSSLKEIRIITPAGNFIIDTGGSRYCASSFIKKLRLDLDISFTGEASSSPSPDFYYTARALLRKRGFIASGDRGTFMNILMNSLPGFESQRENMLKLADRAVSLLDGYGEKALDVLAAKKYYYETVISDSEEFSAMLKTYSMEFLMTKKIQPPPVSVDEALESIRIIDRLTSIVYNMIIPLSDISTQVKFSGDDPIPDIFR